MKLTKFERAVNEDGEFGRFISDTAKVIVRSQEDNERINDALEAKEESAE